MKRLSELSAQYVTKSMQKIASPRVLSVKDVCNYFVFMQAISEVLERVDNEPAAIGVTRIMEVAFQNQCATEYSIDPLNKMSEPDVFLAYHAQRAWFVRLTFLTARMLAK